MVARDTAVLAFDLAADKQVCVLTDPDSRVLARRTVRVKAWQLQDAVRWGLDQARAAGFESVVVACEPTGHRWRVLDETASGLGVSLLCVQLMLVARARVAEDLTSNKNDEVDAVAIARLVTELRCYLPERPTPGWARLRHLAARRARQVTAASSARLQVRDLLECAWPAVLGAAKNPLKSKNWLAAVTVVTDRVGTSGDLSLIRQWGWTRFLAAVRGELARRGVNRVYTPVVRGVFDAATDPVQAGVGVAVQRAGALERVGFVLHDLTHARSELVQVEAHMATLLDELGLRELATSIPGLSAVGAAAILAETGDPTRFASGRALVKHAGLCPRDNSSGAYQGKATISRRGRPQLRLAAWRAVFGALPHNPVLAARYAHLTTRANNRLTPTQARVAVAGALLRQLHAVITTHTAWNPAIAAGAASEQEAA